MTEAEQNLHAIASSFEKAGTSISINQQYLDLFAWLSAFAKGLQDSSPHAAIALQDKANAIYDEARIVREHPQWYKLP